MSVALASASIHPFGLLSPYYADQFGQPLILSVVRNVTSMPSGYYLIIPPVRWPSHSQLDERVICPFPFYSCDVNAIELVSLVYLDYWRVCLAFWIVSHCCIGVQHAVHQTGLCGLSGLGPGQRAEVARPSINGLIRSASIERRSRIISESVARDAAN